jgi:hypothetical protein
MSTACASHAFPKCFITDEMQGEERVAACCLKNSREKSEPLSTRPTQVSCAGDDAHVMKIKKNKPILIRNSPRKLIIFPSAKTARDLYYYASIPRRNFLHKLSENTVVTLLRNHQPTVTNQHPKEQLNSPTSSVIPSAEDKLTGESIP